MVIDFGLPPSEVRQMTLGEINHLVWAKTRGQGQDVDAVEDLYKDFMRLKNG